MARPTGKTVKTKSAPRRAAKTGPPRKLRPIVEILQRLGEMIPEEERARIPKDLTSQIDHYVYGTPKR